MAAGYDTFAAVPWYRKSGAVSAFVLVGFCLFPPLLVAACVVCLTGDVYTGRRRKDGRLSRWPRGNRVAAVVLMPAQVAVVAAQVGGTAGLVVAAAGAVVWLAAVAAALARAARPAAAPPSRHVHDGHPEQPAAPPRSPLTGAGPYWVMTAAGERGPYAADALRRMVRDGFVVPSAEARDAGGGRGRVADFVVTDPPTVVLPAEPPPAQAAKPRPPRAAAGLIGGLCSFLVVAGAVAAVVARVVYSVDSASSKPTAVTQRPAAPPADDRVPVDESRFVASKPGGRVFYAAGLKADADRLDRILWDMTVFDAAAGETRVWLGPAGDRQEFAVRVPDAGKRPANWRDCCRGTGCVIAARFCPGRPAEWIDCDADWRVVGRTALKPAREIVVGPGQVVCAEGDPVVSRRVAARLAELNFFGGRPVTVALLEEPGRRVLAVEFGVAALREDQVAGFTALRAKLQGAVPAGEEAVVWCLMAGAGTRVFAAGPAVIPGPP